MSACPKCGKGMTKVVDSRYQPNGLTRRRRWCAWSCGHKWNTLEVPADIIDADSLTIAIEESLYKEPLEDQPLALQEGQQLQQ